MITRSLRIGKLIDTDPFAESWTFQCTACILEGPVLQGENYNVALTHVPPVPAHQTRYGLWRKTAKPSGLPSPSPWHSTFRAISALPTRSPNENSSSEKTWPQGKSPNQAPMQSLIPEKVQLFASPCSEKPQAFLPAIPEKLKKPGSFNK